jgi:4-diphosphocytidyl-2-C-methyl-D-erythritol kinase
MSTGLGSDATFFLSDTGSAYCTGRGEIVTPLSPLPPRDLYIVKPLVIIPLFFFFIRRSTHN